MRKLLRERLIGRYQDDVDGFAGALIAFSQRMQENLQDSATVVRQGKQSGGSLLGEMIEEIYEDRELIRDDIA